MRILCVAFTSIFLLAQFQTSYAACGSAIGTHRTLSIDTSKYRNFNGKEKGLGLRKKEVILTFDDGPISGKTSRILDTLRKNCVKATFFAVGKMARAHPKLTRRIVREGHTLAHHTINHNRLPKYSMANASAHIDNGIKMVQKAGHNSKSSKVITPFFRFPYLASSKSTRNLLKKKKLVAFGTNIDSLDWKKNSPQTIVNRVMSKLKSQGKGIVLMHDIHNRTVKMLPILLRELKRGGYKIVHMVPRNGKSRVANLEENLSDIEIALAVKDENSKEWKIRKTEEISSAFILETDEFDPIFISSADEVLISSKRLPEVAGYFSKHETKAIEEPIKQLALRTAMDAL